jgi:hypothetical protein
LTDAPRFLKGSIEPAIVSEMFVLYAPAGSGQPSQEDLQICSHLSLQSPFGLYFDLDSSLIPHSAVSPPRDSARWHHSKSFGLPLDPFRALFSVASAAHCHPICTSCPAPPSLRQSGLSRDLPASTCPATLKPSHCASYLVPRRDMLDRCRDECSLRARPASETIL